MDREGTKRSWVKAALTAFATPFPTLFYRLSFRAGSRGGDSEKIFLKPYL